MVRIRSRYSLLERRRACQDQNVPRNLAPYLYFKRTTNVQACFILLFYSWIHSASLGSASLYWALTSFVMHEYRYRRVSLRHHYSRTEQSSQYALQSYLIPSCPPTGVPLKLWAFCTYCSRNKLGLGLVKTQPRFTEFVVVTERGSCQTHYVSWGSSLHW